jgi:hypothetical protein
MGQRDGQRLLGGREPADRNGRADVVVLGGLAWREVDMVGVAAPGEADIEMLSVQAGAREQDPDVDGGALRCIDGRRPPARGVFLHICSRKDRAETARVLDEAECFAGGRARPNSASIACSVTSAPGTRSSTSIPRPYQRPGSSPTPR